MEMTAGGVMRSEGEFMEVRMQYEAVDFERVPNIVGGMVGHIR